MSNSLTFDQIKARHDDLYQEYREEIRGGVLFGADKQKRAIFLERVTQLLSDADEVYRHSQDSHQKAQIETIKAAWQLANATVFNLDTLFKEKFQWAPPLPVTQAGLSHEIETIAYYIFRQKIIDQLNLMLVDAWNMAEAQVGRDAFENWKHGRVYFAHDLLYYGRDWTADVKDEAVSGLFGQLGDTWLEDVVTLEAYLVWRKKMKGFQSNEAGRLADYNEALGAFDARLKIAKRVDIPKVKERIRQYLTARYLNAALKLADEEQAFNVKRLTIHALAESKAKRIYELTGKSDAMANYYDAYGYIRKFYENVIPGIEDKGDISREARKTLIKEFTKHRKIANCFEATVLMYFVPILSQA